MAIALNHLNARQRDAVLHPSGPLLILAGAGSGKTTTMAHRIAHLIVDRHLPGRPFSAFSFTNKAAKELRQRVSSLVVKHSGKNRRETRGMTVTTFHSLCARLLRAHAKDLGFQDNFTILDQNDQIDVLKQVLKNIKIDERRFDPSLILFEIGQAKNKFLRPEEMEEYFLNSKKLSPDYASVAVLSYSRYQEQLQALNSMDFDDLIFHTVNLLEKKEEIRNLYNLRFRHILVDEYQDTNPAQFKILQLLTQAQQNLCVVGDDDQSIYAWRGADPTHILHFKKYYPLAETISLEQNYRSTSRILDAANEVIEKNKARFPKKLWSDRGEGEAIQEYILEEDRAEADFVGEEILRRSKDHTRPWSDFAILYRSNPQSRVFEEALRRKSIPYKIVGGMSFLDRKEVKNVLAYWRLVVNPKDDPALRRILNWPSRGIGKTSIDALGTESFQKEIALFEVLSHARNLSIKSEKTKNEILVFHHQVNQLHQELQQMAPDPAVLANWAKKTLETFGVKRAVEEESEDPIQFSKKWENIEELLHSLGQIQNLDPPALNGAVMLREYLNLMTLNAQTEEQENEKK